MLGAETVPARLSRPGSLETETEDKARVSSAHGSTPPALRTRVPDLPNNLVSQQSGRQSAHVGNRTQLATSILKTARPQRSLGLFLCPSHWRGMCDIQQRVGVLLRGAAWPGSGWPSYTPVTQSERFRRTSPKPTTCSALQKRKGRWALSKP